MSTRIKYKLNHLLRSWLPGTVATQRWLDELDINRHLAKGYVRSGWIRRIGSGAYVRAGDEVGWPGAVYALQSQLNQPIHVGGKTALELQGYAHFLPFGKKHPIRLLGERGVTLPSWFKKTDWGQPIRYSSTNLFSSKSSSSLTDHRFERFSVKVSSPERAILEVLDLVPNDQSYEEAKLLFENLATLRPAVLKTLLKDCRSIKAKRLFFFLADKLGHVWFKEIDKKRVDLGYGKRVIVKGGRYNAEYKITVPEPLKSKETA